MHLEHFRQALVTGSRNSNRKHVLENICFVWVFNIMYSLRVFIDYFNVFYFKPVIFSIQSRYLISY